MDESIYYNDDDVVVGFGGDTGVQSRTDGCRINSTEFGDSTSYMWLVRGLGMATASLSIIGSLTIICTFLRWSDLRTTSRRLLVYISIADLFTATGNLCGLAGDLNIVRGLGNARNLSVYEMYHPPLCVAQSFFTTTSSLSSFFWTCIMAWYLYSSIVSIDPERYKRPGHTVLMHIIGWGFPLLMGVVAVSMGALGADKASNASAGWCFIRGAGDGFTRRDKIVWQMMVGKAWEILTYIIIAVLYARIKCFISRNDHHQTFVTYGAIRAARDVDKKLTLVPVIFILIRMWGTVRALISATAPGFCEDSVQHRRAEQAFLVLQSIGDSSQGLANAVLFVVMTRKVRRRLRRLVCCGARGKSGHTQADGEGGGSAEEARPIIQYQRGGGRKKSRSPPSAVQAGNTGPGAYQSRHGSLDPRRPDGLSVPGHGHGHGQGHPSLGSSPNTPHQDFLTIGGGVFVDPNREDDSDVSTDNSDNDRATLLADTSVQR